MRLTKLILNSTVLTTINWLLFASVFGWASYVNKNLRWWQDLHWHSWLTELEAMVLLRTIPAGSVWILWLVLSCVLTVVWLAARFIQARVRPKTVTKPVQQVAESQAEIAAEPLKAVTDMPETTPELKEKILRLRESLNKI